MKILQKFDADNTISLIIFVFRKKHAKIINLDTKNDGQIRILIWVSEVKKQF